MIGIRSSDTAAALPWRFPRDGESAVEMAASGGGLLQMIRYLVTRDLAGGRLVVMLKDWLYPGADIVFVYPRHTRRPRRQRVLENFVVGCFRSKAGDGG